MKINFKSIFNIFTLLALLASLLGSALTVTQARAAGRCYVNDDAVGANDGTTWANAYTGLQSAIAASCTEIWVAAGTYKPHASDRTISFALETDVAIYGGFAGTETLLSQRNVTTNPTTLSGDLNGNDSGFTNNSENSYHVVTGTSGATLDGVTISGGNADGTTPYDKGGGIYNNSSSPTITNVTISGNSAKVYGGGIYNNTSAPTVTNVTFDGNRANFDGVSRGGGMYETFSSSVLKNVTFTGNSASGVGGGIYFDYSEATITNVTISGNSANLGGGVAIYLGSGSGVVFTNVILANNTNYDCVYPSGYGTINSASSNNIIEVNAPSGACSLTHGVNGNIVGSDPMLGALADNGGSTKTFALLTGSPAINAGTNTGCPSTDQRGVTRASCDIGAYEFNTQSGPAFVVNTNGDANGSCDAYVAGASDCTLREAINAANTISGTDTITFAANYTITLGSQLPAVTSQITITGNGAANTIVQASTCNPVTTLCSTDYRVFEVSGAGNLTLESLTVQHGLCSGSCATDANNGGGIYNAGTLALINITLSNNASIDKGGGNFNGGGIYTTGTLTVTNSTLSGNSAKDGSGGGIYNYGLSGGTATITNSTFSGNSAAGDGGGIYNYASAGITLIVTNSTFSGNIATGGGGIYNFGSGGLNLKNNILANSTANEDCYVAYSTSFNTNLIESNNGCGTPVSTADPLLGPLANNGGSTQTFALLAGSPAINAGNDAVCAAAPVNNTSQNGVSRMQGPHCDVGSFEFNSGGDTVGVFRPGNGTLYMKNANTTGFADYVLTYGLPGDYPVVGDWDGNGTATLGVYRNGNFYLRNSNTNGFADIVIAFGAPGDQPVAGDWDGDGVDTIGLYRSSIGMFFLRNTNTSGAPDVSFSLGISGDVGIAGDWNGDGTDTTGVFRPSNGALYLKNANTTGFGDLFLTYGLPGDKPVTGDWNNDGIDTIGIYRDGGFYLRNSNTNGYADINLALGINGDMPIAGNWDGLP